jgi:putative transposase
MTENRKAYKTDLTDEQWEMIRPHLEVEQTDGRPREVDLREVVNTLRYIEKTGVQWSMLPHDLPAKSTVYEYHSRWAKDGTWDRVVADLNARARKKKAASRHPAS